MGQIVNGTVTLNANFSEQVPTSTGVLATLNLSVPISQNISYTNGTGILNVDTIYGKLLTLTASTPVTLDLTNLIDPAGVTVNFARVREFIVMVGDPTIGHSVEVYHGAANGWSILPATPGITVQPNGGMLSLRDPRSTGASVGYFVGSTSKTITLDPGSSTVTLVSILIVGGSAA